MESESSSRRGAGGEIERFQAISTGGGKKKEKDYLAGRDLTNICLDDEQFTRWPQLMNDFDVNKDGELQAFLFENFSSKKHILTT